MRGISIFLVSFFACTSLHSLSQDTTFYRFKIQGNLIEDTSIYYGKSLEFTAARISQGKDFFVEYNLFSGQTTDWRKGSSDTFRIKNSIWYIKRNGKWTYFFSIDGFKAKRKSIIRVAETDYFFVPQKVIFDKDNVLYEFFARPTKKNTFGSDILRYTFDPLVGIVKILSSDAILVRQKVKTLDFHSMPDEK